MQKYVTLVDLFKRLSLLPNFPFNEDPPFQRLFNTTKYFPFFKILFYLYLFAKIGVDTVENELPKVPDYT